jgi:tRNA(Ile)-lysidine synthase
MALVLALSSATTDLVVAHVLHDMRPRDQAEASQDAARLVADRLGLPFFQSEIAVRHTPGNYEGSARTARYAALAHLAHQAHCPFIATAHHQDDQLETLLMRLLRGAGPRGLSGLARSRPLHTAHANSPHLIRPMLTVSRNQAVDICRATATAWVEDQTNLDLAPLRNALRHRVMPILHELAPHAGEAAVASADLMRQATDLIATHAQQTLARATHDAGPPPTLRWPRTDLRPIPPIVLGELVHQAAIQLAVERGADRRGSSALGPVLAAMGDASTQPRDFDVGSVLIRVDAHAVVIRARPLSSAP